jgi:hypothetical protein
VFGRRRFGTKFINGVNRVSAAVEVQLMLPYQSYGNLQVKKSLTLHKSYYFLSVWHPTRETYVLFVSEA